MDKFSKLGLFSWICQWICVIMQMTSGQEEIFLIMNILFLNTTMAFLFLGNNYNNIKSAESVQSTNKSKTKGKHLNSN